MYKRILTLLTVMLLSFAFVSPSTILAAQIKTMEENEKYVENNEDAQKNNEELLKKWDSLSKKQKNEVYKSIKGTIDAQAKFLDKLVKYELMTKEEAQLIKDDMHVKFDEMKANDSLFVNGEKTEPRKEKGNTKVTPTTPPSAGTTTPTTTPQPAR